MLVVRPVLATECTTIKDAVKEGQPLISPYGDMAVMGFNEYGFNYQAHLFNGDFCDHFIEYREGQPQHEWCVENFEGVKFISRWSDTLLSNVDCNGDGYLDFNLNLYGTDAWVTTKIFGDGWFEYMKFLAKPYPEFDCTEIGGANVQGRGFLDQFCVIQQIGDRNNPDSKGLLYHVIPTGFKALSMSE
jgi:hypothetical protein